MFPTLRSRIPALSLGTAFFGLTLWSWARWPDALIDFGQQLYVGWRIAAGDVIYRDLAYLHGPLSAWLDGGLMRVFGVSLWTLAAFNHLLIAAVTWVWWRLLQPRMGTAAALAGTLVFLSLFAFAQLLPMGNYNWVCPYTYEITHGVALALVAVLALARHTRTGGRGSLVTAGALVGLVFLTKTEVFLAVSVALAGGLVALWLRRPPARGKRLGSLALVVSAALAPPLIATLALAPALGFRGAVSALASPYLDILDPRIASMPLYRRLSGLDRPLVNLSQMLAALVLVAGALGVCAVLAWLAARSSRAVRRLADFGLVAGIVALALGLGAVPWLQLARPLPAVILAITLWTGARILRDRGVGVETVAAAGPEDEVPLFALALLALGLLAKMPLSARLYHYGFALAMPAAVLAVALAVDRLPVWVARRGGRGDRMQVGVMALTALAICGHLSVTAEHYAARTVWIDAGFDGFWADGRGIGVQAAVEALRRSSAPDDTVLVVPDGILISYLARRRTPVPYLNWVPTELLVFGEKQMLADLRGSPPAWVVVVDKPTAEFGALWFGRGYARDIGRWIAESYRPVGGVGAEPLTGRGFGIRWLAARKPVPTGRSGSEDGPESDRGLQSTP